MPFSPNHWIFRCLGLAGPRVLFSLNSSAGPTHQLHTFFLLPREPPPLTHQTAAARTHAAAAPRPFPRRACAAPALRLSHPRTARSAPAPPAAAARCPRATTPSTAARLHCCPSSSPVHSFSSPDTHALDSRTHFFVLPIFRFECTQGVRGFAS